MLWGNTQQAGDIADTQFRVRKRIRDFNAGGITEHLKQFA